MRKPKNDLARPDTHINSNLNPPVYMDGYLRSACIVIKDMTNKDWDVLGVIDGPERGGKSVLAQQVATEIDPNFTINQIVFTPEEFKQAIIISQPGQCIILDEAMTAFFSRAAMSRTNIELVRLLAECGQKRLFILLVLPSFFILDKYAALYRSRFLIHIYTKRHKGMKTPERGYFAFYNRSRKKQLYLLGTQGYRYNVRPNFYGRFTNTYMVDETTYREKKRISLTKSETKKGKYEDLHEKKMWVAISIAANILHYRGLKKAFAEYGVTLVHDQIKEYKDKAEELKRTFTSS